MTRCSASWPPARYRRVIPSDAPVVNGLGVSQQCACFSEIPLDMLEGLVARRSRLGIGFHQLNLIPKGAARVWYLDKDTATRTAMQAKITTAMSGGVDPHDPIWRLTPLVDFAADNYHFEWEREWRIPGGLAFIPTEVAFLFLPEEQHAAASASLPTEEAAPDRRTYVPSSTLCGQTNGSKIPFAGSHRRRARSPKMESAVESTVSLRVR